MMSAWEWAVPGFGFQVAEPEAEEKPKRANHEKRETTRKKKPRRVWTG